MLLWLDKQNVKALNLTTFEHEHVSTITTWKVYRYHKLTLQQETNKFAFLHIYLSMNIIQVMSTMKRRYSVYLSTISSKVHVHLFITGDTVMCTVCIICVLFLDKYSI